jgi:chemotaxis protein CheY-P-specific phosphatase CheC
MATPIVICDDSSFARKQMARALPENWDVDITYATNGQEALTAVEAGKGQMVFLDLNMPVMDGYQMLEAMQSKGLSTAVIVVSGDIQPESRSRVLSLGAQEFIKKPVAREDVNRILDKRNFTLTEGKPVTHYTPSTAVLDGCQEVANVAMGRAVDLIARLLNTFVVMPIPNVNMMEIGELRMMLDQIASEDQVSAVCQGFIGSGISGEALLIFNDSTAADLAKLMNYHGEIDKTVELELFMDVASVFISACLQGISDQLDVPFSQGHPIVLGHHVKVSDLIERNANAWKQTLAIEMGYKLEKQNIGCEVLLFFAEDSLPKLETIISYFTDEQ